MSVNFLRTNNIDLNPIEHVWDSLDRSVCVCVCVYIYIYISDTPRAKLSSSLPETEIFNIHTVRRDIWIMVFNPCDNHIHTFTSQGKMRTIYVHTDLKAK